MTDRIERVLSAILVLAAVAIAVGMIHREFFAESTVASPYGPAPKFEKAWERTLGAGERIGDAAAPVRVVVFSDLECPYCRTFHASMLKVLAAEPKSVSMIFVHSPMAGHRFALPAARAAECARSVGKFAEFISVIFAKQDSLGLKPWGAYAEAAGIQDTLAIASCANSHDSFRRINDGMAMSSHLNVTGTPTILFDGWRVEGGPSTEEITRIARVLKKGGRPF